MNVSASAYPTPNRTELLSYLKEMQANAPGEPLVRNAARHMDEFRAESGEQLLVDLAQARDNSMFATTAGVFAGAAVALIGLATGNALAGIAGGAAVAGTALYLGGKRRTGLEEFGAFIGSVNLLQVLDEKVQAPQGARPQAEPKATFVEAEPMPNGWRPSSKPASDVLIDMVFDPGKGAFVPHTLHQFERPPEPQPPKTQTIIDMTPDGEVSQIRTYQV